MPPPIDFSGAISTGVRGINHWGAIVGITWTRLVCPGGGSGEYVRKPGSFFTDLNYPDHLNTIPVKITDDGVVVGCYHDTDTMRTMHGFLFDGARYTGGRRNQTGYFQGVRILETAIESVLRLG